MSSNVRFFATLVSLAIIFIGVLVQPVNAPAGWAMFGAGLALGVVATIDFLVNWFRKL